MTPMADSARARAGTLVLVLGALIVAALLPFLAGLLGAAVLYVVCAPPHRRLPPLLSPRGAALLAVVVAAVAILLPGTWLVNALGQQAPEPLRSLAGDELLARLASIRIGGVALGARIAAAGDALAAWLTGRTLAMFGSVTQGMLNLVIALFGLYYLLVEGESLWRAVAVRLPFSARGAEVLRRRFHSVTEAMLLGTALPAVL